jgi:hypothetical protein
LDKVHFFPQGATGIDFDGVFPGGELVEYVAEIHGAGVCGGFKRISFAEMGQFNGLGPGVRRSEGKEGEKKKHRKK